MNNRKSVFIHPDVALVRELHSVILSSFNPSGTILELLELMARNLAEACEAGDPRTQVEIKNYMKPGEFEPVDDLLRVNLGMAREIMARQHGFMDWEEVKYGGRVSLQSGFEKAVDLLISGEVDALEKILVENPHLVIQRSGYPHKATLLHYAAANGVEIRRQIVPLNLPDLIRLLLSRGADLHARGFFYNSMMDAKSLLQTGTHTREAGVYEEASNLLI